MLDFILGNKALIGSVIGSVIGGAGALLGYKLLAKDVQKFFKEGFDVYEEFQKAGKDGKYTVQEMKDIAKQTGEFTAVALVFWIKIKKLLKKK